MELTKDLPAIPDLLGQLRPNSCMRPPLVTRGPAALQAKPRFGFL